ncbi:MAG: hypothetical protein K2P09_06620 [Erysipelotrichales bacterium]|nr:hypothetical protein [Erysipelotrichales bacterium]
MANRELKKMCYLDALEDSVTAVEVTLNRLKQIEAKEGVFDDMILKNDKNKTVLDLELTLATLCILLRKMSENLFIKVSDELRRDMNSIIHSNRFEYDHEIVAYSQKGRETIELDRLLKFAHSILLK